MEAMPMRNIAEVIAPFLTGRFAVHRKGERACGTGCRIGRKGGSRLEVRSQRSEPEVGVSSTDDLRPTTPRPPPCPPQSIQRTNATRREHDCPASCVYNSVRRQRFAVLLCDASSASPVETQTLHLTLRIFLGSRSLRRTLSDPPISGGISTPATRRGRTGRSPRTCR